MSHVAVLQEHSASLQKNAAKLQPFFELAYKRNIKMVVNS